MDKITQVTKYRTTDGKEHDTREDAEQHQSVIALANEMGQDLDFRDVHSARDVSKWLFERYTLIQKGKS